MESRVLSGIPVANQIKQEVATEAARLRALGVTPGLAAVLVGDDPASEIYVRSKVKTCGELGLASELVKPSADITTSQLVALVEELNSRDSVDGILVQLPLPKHVDTRRVLGAVHPDKDVDGFHPVNVGRLQVGLPALAPCTPSGVIEMLRRSGIEMAGANAVVIGRSDIVGKPQAILLLQQNATITIAHSKTRDLAEITRRADIVVAAIGRPAFVTADMVRPGATLVDVGINRVSDAAEFARIFTPDQPDFAKREQQFREKGSTLVGDIHPSAFAVSGAYTPVPGGVGPLTIAMLMSNTVKAAKLRRGMTE